jgi:C-terminal processing protease CtpA/Prc
MSAINKIYIRVSIVAMVLFLSGCTKNEDVIPPDVEDYPGNLWIEERMRRYYLWEDEIPEKDLLDARQEAETFFFTLLTEKDGKKASDGSHYYYSTIEKKTDSPTRSYQGNGYSFGFEFQYYYIEQLKVYALAVLYVLPGSPAEKEGMRRGDWIMEIDGKSVSGDVGELHKALDTTLAPTVVFGSTRNFREPVTERRKVTAAVVDDNPVFFKSIIESGGRRIAYLMYNHFTSGPTDEATDELFNNTLREAFAWFKAQEAVDFILDLRYNGGGLVSSAQLLSTMLAPASALDDVFCNLTYNGHVNSYSDRVMKLDSRYMRQGSQGENLNLTRLYVITSSRTASASEAVINGLRPYMDVFLIGEETEGKNVGSVTFEDDRYDWKLHPIVSRLSNKDGFSAYEDGFVPDLRCEEAGNTYYEYEIGDEREYMLNAALQYITGKTRAGSADSNAGPDIKALYNSLDSKKTNGAILSPSLLGIQ